MTDDSWITESIVQLSRSPMWRTPVDNFVDDNCCLFGDGEMTVEQTEVHHKFQALIDNLLTSYVNEIGVSLEDALNAVKNAVDNPSSPSRDAATSFLNNIFYVDDFRSFHKMMLKRNIELDILASRAIYRGVAPRQLSYPSLSSDREHRLGSRPDDDDEAVRLAIAASLKDTEETHKLAELEDVQIQEALALSIAAEEDRLRRAAAAACAEVAPNAAQLGVVAAEQKKMQKLSALEEERAHNIMKIEAKALEVRQEALRRGLTATLEVPPNSASPSPEKRPASPSPASAAQGPALEPKALFHPPPPPTTAKHFGLKALPSIQPSFKQLEATMTAKPSHAATSTGKQAEPNEAQKGGPTLEEMEARAKYMREQREKIVAQNKASRNKELNEYSANGVAVTKPSGKLDEEKKMTIALAQRLREDIIREAKK